MDDPKKYPEKPYQLNRVYIEFNYLQGGPLHVVMRF